jgi:2-polyprenyl-3-methyl-5-hydroxy-6-metoxy-1,4-benzoquinol methylase
VKPSIFNVYVPELADALRQCLLSSDVRHQDLAGSAIKQLRLKYPIDWGDAGRWTAIADPAGARKGLDEVEPILADPLLTELLARTVNVDRELELFLTGVRRALLLAELGAGVASGTITGFMSALAQQAHNNEYVFWCSDEEQRILDDLRHRATVEAEDSGAPGAALESLLLRIAMYASIDELAGAERWAGWPVEAWSPALRPIVQRQLLERAEERELARRIPVLREATDHVSRAVQALYERNPYPRWLSLPSRRALTLAERQRRITPGVRLPPALDDPEPRILIAGCGTGEQAISVARLCPAARVLAVDLSRRSLAYAARMARRLGAPNVEFLQADLLDLGTLEPRFAVIECMGVLHHMRQPARGLQVLVGLLAEQGLIRLGLYSRLARRYLVAARERFRALGREVSDDDVRRFRRELLRTGQPTELRRLESVLDFYSLSECRDLLFHVHEQRFTTGDLSDLVRQASLEFVGFEIGDENVRSAYLAEYPDDSALRNLAQWGRFEERHPDTFLGMYQFWCRK